jgi:hypothetical protein
MGNSAIINHLFSAPIVRSFSSSFFCEAIINYAAKSGHSVSQHHESLRFVGAWEDMCDSCPRSISPKPHMRIIAQHSLSCPAIHHFRPIRTLNGCALGKIIPILVFRTILQHHGCTQKRSGLFFLPFERGGISSRRHVRSIGHPFLSIWFCSASPFKTRFFFPVHCLNSLLRSCSCYFPCLCLTPLCCK